ncbi:MAG: 48 kDa putative inclusion body protein [Plant associated caulimovirus 1]|nr:MAG: 48 kDa putative inclusion body protein [Plant associated caulimovirus 1]
MEARAMQIAIEEKRLEIIQAQNEVAQAQNKLKRIEQELRILELKAQQQEVNVEEPKPEGSSSNSPTPIVVDQPIAIKEEKPEQHKPTYAEKAQQLAKPKKDKEVIIDISTNHRLHEEDEKKTPYFVVHKGPKMGIYLNKAKILDLPEDYYVEVQSKKEAEKVYGLMRQSSLPKKHKSLSPFPSPSSMIEISSRLIKTTISKDEWVGLYKKLGQSTIDEDKVVPFLKHKHLTGMGLQGLSPELLLDYFNGGLLDTIYPSPDLKELIGMPKIRQAISFFMERTRLRQQGKNIYMALNSTIPDWEDGKDFAPYHFIKIGAAGTVTAPAKAKETGELLDEDIQLRRLDGFYFIYRELEQIDTDSCIKLNFCNDNILVISKQAKPVNAKDLAKINKWKESIFEKPRVALATKEKLKEVVPVLASGYAPM